MAPDTTETPSSADAERPEELQPTTFECRTTADGYVCEKRDGSRAEVDADIITTPTRKKFWDRPGTVDAQQTGPDEVTFTKDGSELRVVVTPEEILVNEPGLLRQTIPW